MYFVKTETERYKLSQFLFFFRDPSSFSLILSNGIFAWMALAQSWNFVAILWVYWMQSIIIGVFTVLKIMMLKNFSTEDFKINGENVEPTTETKIKSIFLFILSYGIFHFLYGILLGEFFTKYISYTEIDWSAVFLGVFYFGVHHFFSFLYNMQDLKSGKNIGKMMLFPFARIFPMHLIIILGGVLMFIGGGSAVLLFFLVLKTIADVSMHLVEHVSLEEGVGR